MYTLIDSHCHLDFDTFNRDRDAVIGRARRAGVEHIVIPGVHRKNWGPIRDICEHDVRIHACYGLHPYMADEHDQNDIIHLENWLDTNECVAIGECGLDYRKNQPDRQVQQQFFSAQIGIAHAHGKPVVIHAVRATEDVIKAVANHPGLQGMVHSYSGSYEQALRLIDLGFYISFGGAITYTNAKKLRAAASKLPLDAILLETDAPDQPDTDHHGQRNEPAYLVKVLECLSGLRNEPVEAIAAQTTANAKALFGL
ncbi:MAG: TatD family hydrolase [Thiotrichales bacterium]|nr:MAG: TatD family hydrolase [Thiotrichales bacterium]